MRSVWLALGIAAMCTQPALAVHLNRNQRLQQNGGINQLPPEQNTQTTQTQTAQQGSQSLAQQLRGDLQHSGFSNVRIMPQSFLIRAQDRQGNPVEMVVTPDSVAAVDIGRDNSSLMTGRSIGENAASRFVRGPVEDATDANLTDTNVQGSDHQKVGTIKGIAIGKDGKLSYLLSTDKGQDIAINPAAMSLSYNDSSDKWDATVDATKQQVDSAPPVQYNQKTQQ